MAKNLLTVIMPTLNQNYTIISSIYSVFENSPDQVNLLIADGLSSDRTQDYLIGLNFFYRARINWLSQRDSGPAEAINNLLRMTQSNIIGWLNSDDVYAPGAISRAIAYFNENPNHMMVYGFAEHIDSVGNKLGKYPTRPPSTLIDRFADGCFICQPTVFIRREALEHVGLLDESLKTAFDFDWWLRFFKRYPRQIGFIPRVQAYSRLHAQCLTQRERQTVALEGMEVVSRHLSNVPSKWFFTHVEELCNQYPLGIDERPLVKQVESFFGLAKKYYQSEQLREIVNQLKSDKRLSLSKPGIMTLVEPDGWVSKHLIVKYRWTEKPVKAILLRCLAKWPHKGTMRLRILLPSGETQVTKIDIPSEFILRLEVPPAKRPGMTAWQIFTAQFFVPAKHDRKSSDKRKLSFQVLEVIPEE